MELLGRGLVHRFLIRCESAMVMEVKMDRNSEEEIQIEYRAGRAQHSTAQRMQCECI
jgi:hypothetical protein